MRGPARLGLLVATVLLSLMMGCSVPELPVELGSLPAPTLTLPPAEEVASAFLQAWQYGDLPLMYSLLTPAAQATYPEDQFATTYQQAADAATLLTVVPRILIVAQPDMGAVVTFVAAMQTELFGTLEVQNEMPLSFVQGRWGVDWSPALVFREMRDDTYVRQVLYIPSRGNIYDRDGRGLAVQGEWVEVGIVPGQIQDEAALLDLLSTIMGKAPPEVRAAYQDVNPSWYVPVGRISAEAGQTHYEALSATPGIELRRAWMRSYREEIIAPHVVGVVGPIPSEQVEGWRAKGYQGDELVGRMGLERWGEAYLAGQRGGRLEIVTEQGQQVGVLAEIPSQESSSIYTTFDREFQQRVQEILGERIGAIVVLEANTGRILALATYPAFDPNLFAGGISQERWSGLQDDPRRPLVNRATQGIYPAASVFKTVTMAAGMGKGGLSGESTFVCNGVWEGLGPELAKTCWLRSGHGPISLAEALTVSCDVTFYEIGLMLDRLDPEALPSYAHNFGLGDLTGIEVEELAGLVPDPSWKVQSKGEGWAPGDTVNLAIGQGDLLVTPLQIAVLMAAIGNGGTLYRPAVVEMVASDPSSPEWSFVPMAKSQLPVSAEDLQQVQDSLYKVTSETTGTAYEAFEGLNVRVAGKTGTAETSQGLPHSWFAGYAPAGAPEIAIAVIVEHAGTGAEHAAVLFRQVVESYFPPGL